VGAAITAGSAAVVAFIAKAFEAGLLAWMALLVLLIAVRILRGDIRADGVLLHDEGDASVAPERALTMAIFPVVIISYAYTALNMNLDVPGPVRLPDVPDYLLNLLLASNGLYLAGKIARG
jgi:hypothetical protein